MPSRAVLDAYGLLWVLGQEAEPKPAAPAVTVSDLRALYLAFKEASPKPPSPRTLKDYRQYVRDHIDSHWFGALLADDVDQDQARRWQAEIAAKPGYSNESAMKVRTSVVAPAFQWARISTKKGQVPIRTWSSPFDGLPMLETVVQRRDRLESIDEIHAFISCAYEVDPNWGDLVVAKAVQRKPVRRDHRTPGRQRQAAGDRAAAAPDQRDDPTGHQGGNEHLAVRAAPAARDGHHRAARRQLRPAGTDLLGTSRRPVGLPAVLATVGHRR